VAGRFPSAQRVLKSEPMEYIDAHAHLGDGSAYVVRDGTPRKLTIEHTLANAPDLRAAQRERPGDPEVDVRFARFVVLRALGFNGECPAFDVARAEGLSRIVAEILDTNGSMIRLSRKLGFTIKGDPLEGSLTMELDLTTG